MRLLVVVTAFLIAHSAEASVATYSIQFSSSNIGDLLPTAASFGYDPSTQTFSSFLVSWNGLKLDLTTQANAPTVFTMPACLGSLTGGAATYALLSGACDSPPVGQVTLWSAAAASAGGPGSFHLLTRDPSCGNDPGCVFFDVGALVSTGASVRAQGQGTWSIAAVPEPRSFGLLALILIPLLRRAHTARLHRS